MVETAKANVFQALIRREPNFLDKPLEELLPLRFMGEVAVNAYQGLIRRLDDLPLAEEERKAKLSDAQDAGAALLAIEARIGELAKKEPQVQSPKKKGEGVAPSRVTALASGKPPKNERLGMTRHQMYVAETIASHPEAVAEVIAEAKKNEDIPTKTAVLNKVAYKLEKERVKKKRETTRTEMRADALQYLLKLEQAAHLIPARPPKNLFEKDFLVIKAKALLIMKRLELFRDAQAIEILNRAQKRMLGGR
jgi:hypothetical protein